MIHCPFPRRIVLSRSLMCAGPMGAFPGCNPAQSCATSFTRVAPCSIGLAAMMAKWAGLAGNLARRVSSP